MLTAISQRSEIAPVTLWVAFRYGDGMFNFIFLPPVFLIVILLPVEQTTGLEIIFDSYCIPSHC
jgi:hypothetical protein